MMALVDAPFGVPLAPRVATLPNVGDVVGGKLRITETLGQGGMGVVLGGEHLDLQQPVAIKVMRPALAREPDALARFLREARAAASITSRHAVRIHDVGTTEEGLPYMVMERLDGIGVEALLEERGALPVDEALRIVVEAAEAIAEANRLGIVHRDVKPSNLFLARDASGGSIVKVLDFGISKRLPEERGHVSSLTAPQTILGSPQYMSPEQLRDSRAVDERTDVWGLGVTLYELLTGCMPFESDSMAELCALIFNAAPRRLSAVRSEIPPGLDEVVARCLAKSALDRTPSVLDLVSELVPFCHGELATVAAKLARRPRETVRARSPGSRPRVALMVAGSSVLLVVALVVTMRHERSPEGTVAAVPASVTAAVVDVQPLPSVDAAAPLPSTIPSSAASSVLRVTPRAQPRPSPSLKGIRLMD